MSAKAGKGGGVLFACNMNSVRSPMAEAIGQSLLGGVEVDSVGVYEGALDPFVEMILAEDGIVMEEHQPKTFDEIDPAAFNVVIALTPQAMEAALKHFPASAVEQWQVPNPTDERGSRDRMLAAYRQARDVLKMRIIERFSAS